LSVHATSVVLTLYKLNENDRMIRNMRAVISLNIVHFPKFAQRVWKKPCKIMTVGINHNFKEGSIILKSSYSKYMGCSSHC
jgi:hypothetical protein